MLFVKMIYLFKHSHIMHFCHKPLFCFLVIEKLPDNEDIFQKKLKIALIIHLVLKFEIPQQRQVFKKKTEFINSSYYKEFN